MDLKIRIAAAFVSTHTNMNTNTNTNANTKTQTCIHMRIRTYLFVDCPLFHPKKKFLKKSKVVSFIVLRVVPSVGNAYCTVSTVSTVVISTLADLVNLTLFQLCVLLTCQDFNFDGCSCFCFCFYFCSCCYFHSHCYKNGSRPFWHTNIPKMERKKF